MIVKVKDLADANLLKTIAEILNKGNQVEIKRERENVVVVEVKRKALIKSPISED